MITDFVILLLVFGVGVATGVLIFSFIAFRN